MGFGEEGKNLSSKGFFPLPQAFRSTFIGNRAFYLPLPTHVGNRAFLIFPIAGEGGGVASDGVFAVVPIADASVFNFPWQNLTLHTAEFSVHYTFQVGFAVVGEFEKLPQAVSDHDFGDQPMFTQVIKDRFAVVRHALTGAPAPGSDLFDAAVGEFCVEFFTAAAQTVHLIGHFHYMHKRYGIRTTDHQRVTSGAFQFTQR